MIPDFDLKADSLGPQQPGSLAKCLPVGFGIRKISESRRGQAITSMFPPYFEATSLAVTPPGDLSFYQRHLLHGSTLMQFL